MLTYTDFLPEYAEYASLLTVSRRLFNQSENSIALLTKLHMLDNVVL